MADTTNQDRSSEDSDFLSSNRFERDDVSRADSASDDLSTEDLEAAYLRAMEAIESEEWSVDSDSDSEFESESEFDSSDRLDPSDDNSIGLPGNTDSNRVASPVPNESSEVEGNRFVDANAEANSSREAVPLRTQSVLDEVEIAGADFLSGDRPDGSVGQDHVKEHGSRQSVDVTGKPSSTPSNDILTGGSTRATDAARPAPNATRIIESCLFVGGQPLSAKRLATLLESTSDPSHLEHLVDELNLEYASQQRPYEIRLGDGGYRMVLRTEFEAVRNRVYGVGPRDVKLSQDVLEVLALVAYQQPILHSAVEACGKPNVANILRQLLRRELINLTRVDQTRMGVEYRTSLRFLQVFGLGNLNELPRPEDLAMR